MKNKFFYLLPIAALVALFAFNACKNDDDDDDHHGNEATITITSPQEGQKFHNGETVPIKATLTGTEDLHGWEIVIRKATDDTVLFEADTHTHGLSLTIDTSWTNTLTEHTDLELEIFAQLDHDGKKTSKVVHFHAHE